MNCGARDRPATATESPRCDSCQCQSAPPSSRVHPRDAAAPREPCCWRRARRRARRAAWTWIECWSCWNTGRSDQFFATVQFVPLFKFSSLSLQSGCSTTDEVLSGAIMMPLALYNRLYGCSPGLKYSVLLACPFRYSLQYRVCPRNPVLCVYLIARTG